MSEEQASLNRKLAEALGWTTKELPQSPRAGTYTILLTPEGKCVYSFGRGGGAGEAQAWKHVPDFYGSVDATLATLMPDECGVELSPRWKGDYEAVIRNYRRIDNVNSHAYKGEGTTRAWALAEARLAMARSISSDQFSVDRESL